MLRNNIIVDYIVVISLNFYIILPSYQVITLLFLPHVIILMKITLH